jgi:hypothetical protein
VELNMKKQLKTLYIATALGTVMCSSAANASSFINFLPKQKLTGSETVAATLGTLLSYLKHYSCQELIMHAREALDSHGWKITPIEQGMYHSDTGTFDGFDFTSHLNNLKISQLQNIKLSAMTNYLDTPCSSDSTLEIGAPQTEGGDVYDTLDGMRNTISSSGQYQIRMVLTLGSGCFQHQLDNAKIIMNLIDTGDSSIGSMYPPSNCEFAIDGENIADPAKVNSLIGNYFSKVGDSITPVFVQNYTIVN